MFKMPSLFKLPQHRQFDYIPRYYDPEKEEMQERLAEKRSLKNIIRQENKNNDDNNIENEENRQERLSMAFKEARRHKNMYQKGDKKSALLRLGLTFLMMGMFALWFFAGEALTNYIVSGDNRTTFPLILAAIFGAIIVKNVLNFKR
ncbi:MAG: hypothetical protein EAZ85_10935 [Bacteroidetes bacterium]|nr:MAG: hypothetical protein EAZ85_10935 [Bacteroidota bacterium]TAG94501.1 MAG: hypothetical protein EAZ20_00845 [Bacteroidota bacterium]